MLGKWYCESDGRPRWRDVSVFADQFRRWHRRPRRRYCLSQIGPGGSTLTVEVARAQIAALRTAGDPESRNNSKTELVRNPYSAGYDQDEIREIFRLIDWMMHLRSDLDRRFKSELIAYEKKRKMPYITSVECLAKEEGREEGLEEGLEKGLVKGREQGLEQGLEKGREQGSITLLLRILTRRCGQLPEEIEREVHRLSLAESQSLGDALFDIQTMDDLKNWLKTRNG